MTDAEFQAPSEPLLPPVSGLRRRWRAVLRAAARPEGESYDWADYCRGTARFHVVRESLFRRGDAGQ